MSIEYVSGDIAQSDAGIIVNTVNCVGVMGKGVALAVKNAFPEIFPRYAEACKAGKLHPGGIMMLGTRDGRIVANLASKKHWRDPSQRQWAGGSLFFLNYWLDKKDIAPCRIAMPLPGAGLGGIDPQISHDMVRSWMAPALARGFSLDIYAPAMDFALGPIAYAGVGARETPADVLAVMRDFGGLAAAEGWLLRSGGARGADTAFHDGAKALKVKSEIFLPEEKSWGGDYRFATTDVHYRIMRALHPTPEKLTGIALELMARNGCQVYGQDFTNPSRVVVCWTEGGKDKGGTAQAIRLAGAAGIPILNLGRPDLKGITASAAFALARDMVVERESLLQRTGFPTSNPVPC
ncbi:macro domain-containing protein [Paracoccus litorisediminis]|uniref:macro domain-containing protein n=1 Tax=Paracoccus litorisediminis TaxID=2006130 RepID=UPI003730BFC6